MHTVSAELILLLLAYALQAIGLSTVICNHRDGLSTVICGRCTHRVAGGNTCFRVFPSSRLMRLQNAMHYKTLLSQYNSVLK